MNDNNAEYRAAGWVIGILVGRAIKVAGLIGGIWFLVDRLF